MILARACASWGIVSRANVTYLRCSALDAIPGVAHFVSTRRNGKTELDLAPVEGPPAARAQGLARAAGLAGRLLRLRQVHGTRLRRPGEAAGAPPCGDGWLWERERDRPWAVAVATADCVPVILADESGARAALLHAGWRGIAGGIVERALEALAELDSPPRVLRMALGPAIGGCCYRVDRERWRRVAGADAAPEGGDTGVPLDLREVLVARAVRAGIAAEAVFVAPWCTACRADLFHSFRRDGEAAGRMLAVLGAAALA